MSAPAPASRPVHPCVLSLTEGTRGAEYSTWAHITTRKPHLPNLVTASACTLNVYSLDERTAKLRLEHSFGNLAGSVVFLATLSPGQSYNDALLLGFAGHPRLTIVQVADSLLQAVSLLDLTPALQDAGFGAVSPLEQDPVITSIESRPGLVTVGAILGGGCAVAVIEVAYHKSIQGWMAHEPYILPLSALSSHLPHNTVNPSLSSFSVSFGTSLSTGFGDIFSATFLSGYLEPVLVLLHSDPGGRTWPGRLGRENGEGGANPYFVTALSVSVAHRRAALLWSQPVTADASLVVSFAKTNCLVIGVNTLIVLEAGIVKQVMAVNGWARSTCPVSLQSRLQANPLVKLAVSLDGCAISWLSSQSALLSLRTGQLYVLQQTVDQWTLLPTGQTLAATGEVKHLVALPFREASAGLVSKITEDKATQLSMGVVFAASRLGNSLLLGYALETVKMPWDVAVKQEGFVKQEFDAVVKQEESDSPLTSTELDEEQDRILQLEEEALYAPTKTIQEPDVVPPSDEEQESDKTQKRQRVSEFSVVRVLTSLDSLVNLGPIGPSCEGPLSWAPSFLTEAEPATGNVNSETVFGAPAFIFPSGYGSSGGIAVATAVGRDDRMILAEEDCLNVECIFGLPTRGLVLLGMSKAAGGGTRVLRLQQPSQQPSGQKEDQNGYRLHEVNIEEWSTSASSDGGFFDSVVDVFRSKMYSAGEFGSGHFAVLASTSDDEPQFVAVVLEEKGGTMEIRNQTLMDKGEGDLLLQVTPFVQHEHAGSPVISFGCCWSSGKAQFFVLGLDGFTFSRTFEVEGPTKVEDAMDVDDNDDDQKEVDRFYQNGRIVSIDVFKGPKHLFCGQSKIENDIKEGKESTSMAPTRTDVDWSKLTVAKLKEGLKGRGLPTSGKKAQLVALLVESDLQRSVPEQEEFLDKDGTHPSPNGNIDLFDEDDEDLYGISFRPADQPSSHEESVSTTTETEAALEEVVFLAVCRQSGKLEVYSGLEVGVEPTLCWAAAGFGQGVVKLEDSRDYAAEPRHPRFHMIAARECRFFSCGPTTVKKPAASGSSACTFCVALEKSSGDIELYAARRSQEASGRLLFYKIPLRSVARPSHGQIEHHKKLVRKGHVGKDMDEADGQFSYNRLHRFHGISGQAGLFAAVCQPTWFVAERGRPTALLHRTRHAAPAGGKPRPVSGFCAGIVSTTTTSGEGGGFLTLHERVGRIGSQRLTVFRCLSDVFSSQGLLSGSSGLCIEKIPMGVTIRRIEFIDDPRVSSGDHPLYAMLVSRELEVDQSSWNSDGLSPEEREKRKEEKEAEKIKKQVEADLGGFDMDSEWVEEIEREDCFKVDTELGGAPPAPKQAYSLWIVDAANKWMVVDSFDFNEWEHAMTMKVMDLSEFKEDPGSAGASSIDEEVTNDLFVTVGTGVVDHNGEDVTSKGRVLLFRMKRPQRAAGLASAQVAELSVAYEKQIFHGPVTSLSCLPAEGRDRLVIGAGADVNVEQWGNGKLTQVGFFRATMQILDIHIFKNFFILSDAYDSLYFLVWRESDKSLTLLAKDYDPIPVYAAGIMSRAAAMTFLCHDDRQNLQFFQYAPGEAAARGGNKLVCRADFHLGTQTTSFTSHYCRSSLLIHSATPISTLAALKQQDRLFGRSDDDQRLGVFFGTTDGGLGAVVPLSDSAYWTLAGLQSVMANAIESDCALSPRAWRLYRRTNRRGGCRSNDRKKGVIDGDLVLQYVVLPTTDQEDLASSIASTVDMILDNLLEIQCGSLMM